MTIYRTHSAEFKRNTVQLTRTSGTLAGTAHNLSINVSLLQIWRNVQQTNGERAFPGQGRQVLSPKQQEIQRLRNENEILRQEWEILRQPTAFFAKEAVR